jgi:hypothetical protein
MMRDTLKLLLVSRGRLTSKDLYGAAAAAAPATRFLLILF